MGAPYGSTFEVQSASSGLVRIDPVPIWDSITTTEKDNANLLDDGSAQALTGDEIVKMRSEGKAGADIIEALKQSSATFAAKASQADDRPFNRPGEQGP